MKPTTAFLIGITAAVLLTKSCCMIASAKAGSAQDALTKTGTVDFQAEKYGYKLTGLSNLSGERVIAYLNQDPSDPSHLTGIILEGHCTYHTQGHWNGKGLVHAKTIISTYSLEVIE